MQELQLAGIRSGPPDQPPELGHRDLAHLPVEESARIERPLEVLVEGLHGAMVGRSPLLDTFAMYLKPELNDQRLLLLKLMSKPMFAPRPKSTRDSTMTPGPTPTLLKKVEAASGPT